MSSEIPADSDDHDGGDARRGAAGTWNGHRFRTSEAVGNHDYRRLDGEPASHLVHDACGLFSFWQTGISPAFSASWKPRRRSGTRSGNGVAHEHLDTFH